MSTEYVHQEMAIDKMGRLRRVIVFLWNNRSTTEQIASNRASQCELSRHQTAFCSLQVVVNPPETGPKAGLTPEGHKTKTQY